MVWPRWKRVGAGDVVIKFARKTASEKKEVESSLSHTFLLVFWQPTPQGKDVPFWEGHIPYLTICMKRSMYLFTPLLNVGTISRCNYEKLSSLKSREILKK